MKLTKQQQAFNDTSDKLWEKGYTLCKLSSVEQGQLDSLQSEKLPKNIGFFIDIPLCMCPKELKKYHWYDKLFLNISLAKKFYKIAEDSF